jgi:hypothetical protein
MNKQKALRILNPLLLIASALQIANVVLLKLDPPAFAYQVHEWNGFVLIGLATLHLLLNASWFKSSFFIKKK